MLAVSLYGTIPLFWLALHPFVERWRQRGRRAYAVILPLWAGFIAAAFAAMWPWRGVHLWQTPVTWIPAVCMFAMGISIYRAAFADFDRAKVSGLAELEPHGHRQRLVTGGIREQVRHPIYLGHLCEMVGWSLGTGLAPLYVMLLFAVVTGAVMVHIEDRELEARFGEEYRAYRARVPAVIPRWRRSAP
jgi:protein-S-isoprenylcysteine O-methyltransferase Ste14